MLALQEKCDARHNQIPHGVSPRVFTRWRSLCQALQRVVEPHIDRSQRTPRIGLTGESPQAQFLRYCICVSRPHTLPINSLLFFRSLTQPPSDAAEVVTAAPTLVGVCAPGFTLKFGNLRVA